MTSITRRTTLTLHPQEGILVRVKGVHRDGPRAIPPAFYLISLLWTSLRIYVAVMVYVRTRKKGSRDSMAIQDRAPASRGRAILDFGSSRHSIQRLSALQHSLYVVVIRPVRGPQPFPSQCHGTAAASPSGARVLALERATSSSTCMLYSTSAHSSVLQRPCKAAPRRSCSCTAVHAVIPASFWPSD